jgi:predicted GIY-YIG superfamily endonuclease
LVYVEPQEDRRTAMKREIAIKGMARERKRKLIGSREVPGRKVNKP